MSIADAPIFAEMTRRVDAALGIETSNEVTYALRTAAVAKAGLGAPQDPKGSSLVDHEQALGFGHERFLDTEIVAIYW